MFNLLNNLAKAAVKTAVILPLSAVADVATLGGELVDRKKSFTGETLKDIGRNLKEASED